MSSKIVKKFGLGLISVLLSFHVIAQSPKEAAVEYCNSYHPSVWASLDEGASLHQIYAVIISQQQARVINSDFITAVDNADKTNMSRFFYTARDNINALIKENWKCELFDDFFLPKQRVVTFALNGIVEKRIDPNDKNTLIITITYDGNILLGSSPLASTDTGVITEALRLEMNGRSAENLNLVIYADVKAEADLLTRVVAVLAGMGIKSLDLVDYQDSRSHMNR